MPEIQLQLTPSQRLALHLIESLRRRIVRRAAANTAKAQTLAKLDALSFDARNADWEEAS